MKEIKLNSILIYFVPIALITGPLIPDILISLISIIFVIEIIKEKNFQYFRNKFTLIFIIFYLISVLSSVLSDNILISLKSSFFYFRFGLFALCIYKYLEENKINFKVFFYFLLFDLVLLNIDGYYQYFFGKNLIGIESVYGNERLNSFFGDEYILGSYLTRIIFIFLAIFYKIKFNSVISEFSLFSLLTSTYFLVFLSGERTAFFLFSIGLLIFFILNNYKFIIKVILFFSILTTLSLILIFNDSTNERYLNLLLKELGVKKWEKVLFKNENKKINFLPQHTTYLIVSYNMFKDKKLLGHGNKSFSYKCEEYKINTNSCSTHPHNTYMQILAENGIINFSIIIFSFVFLLFYIIKNIFIKYSNKKKSISNYRVLLIISIFITLWPLTQTGSFFNNWLSILYFLPVGFFLHEFKKR